MNAFVETQKLRSRFRLHLIEDDEWNFGVSQLRCSRRDLDRSRLCLFGYSRTRPGLPGSISNMEQNGAHPRVAMDFYVSCCCHLGETTLITWYHVIRLALENLDPDILQGAWRTNRRTASFLKFLSRKKKGLHIIYTYRLAWFLFFTEFHLIF